MPWFPVSESNIGYSFSSATAEMVGSVISATAKQNSAWSLGVDEPSLQFRITPLVYLVTGSVTTPARLSVGLAGVPVNQSNTGGASLWTPNPTVMTASDVDGQVNLGFLGAQNVSAPTETYSFQIEVLVDPATPPNDLGTTSKANVSGYIRNRVMAVNVYPPETRALVLNLNGAMPADRTIESVTWQTWQNSNVLMSNAQIPEGQRSASVLIAAQYAGRCVIQAAATLDNGEIIAQNFSINVQSAPVFSNPPWVTGPSSLTAVYP
jgi:hypothetical protein